ncbi:hypothetical protein ACQP3F_34460, partial [Escherichia coli]
YKQNTLTCCSRSSKIKTHCHFQKKNYIPNNGLIAKGTLLINPMYNTSTYQLYLFGQFQSNAGKKNLTVYVYQFK